MNESEQLEADLRLQIETAYEEAGYTLGWRLLYSPAATLNGAKVAFIGLNPAVGGPMEKHSDFSTPGYSAYISEDWGSRSTLQPQVVALFAALGEEPVEVLAGNLVPFRSAGWNDLPNRDKALAFGKTLWSSILAGSDPSLVVTMGSEVARVVAEILKARRRPPVLVGWGGATAWAADYDGGTMVALPHLSRFGIVTRPQSQHALRSLFGDRWRP